DASDPRLMGHKPSEIPLGTALSMEITLGETIMFDNVMPSTPSGKIEIKSTYLAEVFGQGIPTYTKLEDSFPLYLVTPSSSKMITSTFGGVKANDDTPSLEMHPEDAKFRGLEDGAQVRVYNDLGTVFLPLKVTDNVREGVLYSPKGSWFRTTPNDQTVSALAPTTKADLSQGACFNDCKVEVVVA
ncbi:MAG: molybdopterin dinucleotide binding domain-containing protein, partial [Sneathiella sp.]